MSSNNSKASGRASPARLDPILRRQALAAFDSQEALQLFVQNRHRQSGLVLALVWAAARQPGVRQATQMMLKAGIHPTALVEAAKTAASRVRDKAPLWLVWAEAEETMMREDAAQRGGPLQRLAYLRDYGGLELLAGELAKALTGKAPSKVLPDLLDAATDTLDGSGTPKQRELAQAMGEAVREIELQPQGGRDGNPLLQSARPILAPAAHMA